MQSAYFVLRIQYISPLSFCQGKSEIFSLPAEEDYQKTCRTELPGTVEHDHKREADDLAQEAGKLG